VKRAPSDVGKLGLDAMRDQSIAQRGADSATRDSDTCASALYLSVLLGKTVIDSSCQ
jgi:hypothetical protein